MYSKLIVFITFFICIKATVYTFNGNANDLLDYSNWSPEPTSQFTPSDDLILPVGGSFSLSMPIIVNSVTISEDISITGDEITLTSTRRICLGSKLKILSRVLTKILLNNTFLSIFLCY